MLEIKRFEVNMLQENCYVVSDDTFDCMIVDCGAYFPEEIKAITNYISHMELNPVMHVLTHAHLDHLFGAHALYEEYGLKTTLCIKDEKMYADIPKQAEMLFGMHLDYDMPPVEKFVKDGDIIKFGDSAFKVIETPGHTPGSMLIYNKEEGLAFSGDTLFKGSIGRTDLPGGSMFQIIQSLRMITQYPDDTRILPGHGPETTIGYECETNMYLDR